MSQTDKHPLKILRITASMNPQHGGPVQMIRSTTAMHREMGHRTDVVSLDPPGSDYLNEGVQAIPLGPGKYGWAYSPALRPWLENHLEEYNAVILHGLWLYPSVAITNVINRKGKNGVKTPPCFLFPHGMLDPWFQSWRRRPVKTLRNVLYWHFLEKKTIQAVDTVLYTSQTEMRLGKQTFRGYRSKEDQVIPYGCTTPPPESETMKAAFREKCPALGNSPYWLYLSRIHPKKGVDLLVEKYLKLLRKPVTDIPHLVIAGPGTDTTYEQQIVKMASAASTRIHFPGMLGGESKWGAFYGAGGFFLPSHQENFGISVAEALGCGIRVYISDQVNIHEEIARCDAGVVAKDDGAGTERLLELALNDYTGDQKEEHRKKARLCFEQHFNIAKTAESLIDLIHQRQI